MNWAHSDNHRRQRHKSAGVMATPSSCGRSAATKSAAQTPTIAFTAATLYICLHICCLLQLGEAHVALTYPPARKYDLDFLDNSRTKGPCGMPKGEFQLSNSHLCIHAHTDRQTYLLTIMYNKECEFICMCMCMRVCKHVAVVGC